MPSLYELNKDYKELQAMLEVAETDEDMEAIQNTLDMLDCSIDEKNRKYCNVYPQSKGRYSSV